MANAPQFEAFIVEEREGQEKPFWRSVAPVWKHKNGNGLDLIIPAGIALTGRIVIVERKEREAADRPEGQQRRAPAPGPSGRR